MGAQLSTNESDFENSAIIAVVGLIGSGKSTFINRAVGQDALKLGHALKPLTSEIQHVAYHLPGDEAGKSVIFLEVPGFDSEREEKTIVRKLDKYLKDLDPSRRLKITGVIFLHRITDDRFSLSPRLLLTMLETLCERSINGRPNRVVLVTTMWSVIRGAPIGICREAEIRKYWDALLPGSDVSEVMRFEDSSESAAEIVGTLLGGTQLAERSVGGAGIGKKVTSVTRPAKAAKSQAPAPLPPPELSSRPYEHIIIAYDSFYSGVALFPLNPLYPSVVGQTSTGKSTFINGASQARKVGSKSGGASAYTSALEYAECTHPRFPKRRIIFVELEALGSPRNRGAAERSLGRWLDRFSAKLSGIIYLYRGSDKNDFDLSWDSLTRLRAMSMEGSRRRILLAGMNSANLEVAKAEELQRRSLSRRCQLPVTGFDKSYESVWNVVLTLMDDPLWEILPLLQPSIDDGKRWNKDEARCIVDCMSKTLEDSAVMLFPEERKLHQRLLTKLAKDFQLFPESFKLRNWDVRCDLASPLNEGGFGLIYKGEFQQQEVCLKRIRVLEGKEHSNVLMAHIGELMLMNALSHENVLPFYGVYCSGEDVTQMCIVSPWIQYGDLRTYLDTVADAPRYLLLRDIAYGLRYLHDMNIVHADLKASNVLISKGPTALLADFGISESSATSSDGSRTAPIGSAHWMAPELLMHLTFRPSTETDVWAFGCVTFEIATGGMPFSDYMSTPQLTGAFMKHRVTLTRPAAVGIPKEGELESPEQMAWSVIEKCCNHSPEKRPGLSDLVPMVSRLDSDIRVRDALVDFEKGVRQAKIARTAVDIDYPRGLSILRRRLSGRSDN